MSSHSDSAIRMARGLGVIDGKKADSLYKLDAEAVFDALDEILTTYHEQHNSSDKVRDAMSESIFVDTEFNEIYF